MRRYPVSTIAAVFLALVISQSCSESTTTYNNAEFGFSVVMPQSWQMVENPADSFGRPLGNTIVFRSDSSRTAERVSVQVEPGETILSTGSAFTHIPNVEQKIHELGENGFVVESRYLQDPEKEVALSYYIEHNGCLYKIFFTSRDTTEKVHVSIDGYGEVDY